MLDFLLAWALIGMFVCFSIDGITLSRRNTILIVLACGPLVWASVAAVFSFDWAIKKWSKKQ